MSSPADFSKEATKKAVLRATLENPVTMYSTGVGILGSVAIGLFGATGIPVAAAVGGFGLGVGSWMLNYFVRGRKIADAHLKRLCEDLERRREKILKSLEKSLKKAARSAEGEIKPYAKQGALQFAMAEERFQTLEETLRAKLKPGEMTFGRYLGAAEQVYLSVLDNLSIVASVLDGASTIDADYIRSRLSDLKALKSPEPADEAEFKTLAERQALLKAQLSKVNDLLTRNEVAITGMDKLIAALAEVKIIEGGASVDLDSALDDMSELAARAQKYAEPG